MIVLELPRIFREDESERTNWKSLGIKEKTDGCLGFECSMYCKSFYASRNLKPNYFFLTNLYKTKTYSLKFVHKKTCTVLLLY
jgi:hypothetical protein